MPVDLTLQQLIAIMPRCPLPSAGAYLPHLKAAMAEAEINTPLRAAAFLAQLAHESGHLRWWREFADGSDYGPSKNPKLASRLGNRTDAEAMLYRGRGPIQITGRFNMEACGKALGLDLLRHPDLLERPEHGFRSAGWFWSSNRLNGLADAGDFRAITKRINGGLNHFAEREALFKRALLVLGAKVQA